MRELLHQTFKELRGLGITNSGNDFSRTMLGRSSRYYSWVLATGHEPDLGALVGLYARIDDLCAIAEMTGDMTRATALDGLTSRLWDTIRHQSLVKGPNRRKIHGADDGRGAVPVRL